LEGAENRGMTGIKGHRYVLFFNTISIFY